MATEKRLIDRNEIFPNGTFFANAEDPLKSLDELIARIWSIPTVDAVEAVRCKDCKHSGMYEFGDGSNGERLACLTVDDDGFVRFATTVDPDHFCGYGERKDNG